MNGTPIRLARPGVALLPLVLSLGCSPAIFGPRQIERDMARALTDIERIYQVNSETQRRLDAALAAMQTKSDADTEMIVRSLAELEQRIGALQEQLGIIRSQVEEIRFRSVGEGGDTVAVQVGRGESASTVVVEGSKLLLEGEKALAQEHFASARASFQEFLRLFPTSTRAASTWVRIGDSFYRESKWIEARAAYEIVERQYLTSPRVPEAMMKSALCDEQLGREAEAMATLQRLVDRYPKWDQIARAQDMLERLLKVEPLVPPAPKP